MGGHVRGGTMWTLLVVALAGCTDDDQPSAESTAAATSAAPTTAVTSPPPTSPPGADTTAAPQTTVDTLAPSTSADVTTSTPEEPRFTPTLEPRDCPVSHPENAECSTLTVAADRNDTDGGTIDLPVVVLRATGAAPVPDPIVIPAGGPGYPGADALGWADSRLNEERDIVLYDQRGTGGAVPNLECPAVDAAFVAALQDDGSYVAERDAAAAARADCLSDLEADGVDLSDYHSEASAADLDELRRALGYEKWNVLGISYGARLALATMRS